MDQTAQTLLSDFGRAAGIEGLAFDDNGYVLLTFDDIEVSLEQGGKPEELLLHARVGDAPRVADGALFGKVLEANFAAAANGLGTLALDREAMQFVYVERLPLHGMGQTQFQDALRRAVDHIEFWRSAMREPFLRGDTAGQPSRMPSGIEPASAHFAMIRA